VTGSQYDYSETWSHGVQLFRLSEHCTRPASIQSKSMTVWVALKAIIDDHRLRKLKIAPDSFTTSYYPRLSAGDRFAGGQRRQALLFPCGDNARREKLTTKTREVVAFLASIPSLY